MLIRPVTNDDFAQILQIAQAAGIGMTSLPAHEEVLNNKIQRSIRSFTQPAQNDEQKNNGLYFFVLEDPQTKQIVGTTAIEAFVGLKRPFYSYKLTTLTQHSDMLDIYSRNDVLEVVNDHTGTSEIGSLFLLPEYRRDRLGRLLSRVRFLFMGQFPQFFSTKVIAEIRGFHDADGNSPFYNSLAKKFFQIPFAQADWLCATKGNKFIAELMPNHPIYVNLLPKSARECIGRAYVNSEPAKAMLEHENFTFNNYLDIFDGGPTMEAKLKEIATIKNMQRLIVQNIEPNPENATKMMIACTDFTNFKASIGFLSIVGEGATIDLQTANLLNLQLGNTIIASNA